MKRSLILFLLVLGLALPSLAQVKKGAVVTVSPLITAIEVKGNHEVAEREIMNLVFSRVGDSLLEEKIKNDVKAIYALGSFSDVAVSFEALAGGTRVVFQVFENPKVSAISFEGNSVYPQGTLLALIKTQPGNILNYKTLQGDIDLITSRYKDDGYVLVRIVDADVDKTTGLLHFKIVEGLVESIALEGNDQTKDFVILRELKTHPGSVFNENVFKKDLRRVFNLGFFSEVSPNFAPGSSPDKVVIQLKIKETRTSTINFGGGYGESEGGFGFIDLSLNNLLGTAQGMLIRGQFGQNLSTYQFKYTNPWFWPKRFGEHAAFTLRKWYTIGRDIYISDQSGVYNGFDVSLGRPFYDNYNITWSLGSELVSPYSTSTFESYQSDTLGLSLSYDTRDFWLNPKEGRFYTLGVKHGWKHAGSGNTTFFKTESDINHYHPVLENQILATHVGVGMGSGDVPIGEKFWAGGANTIRGYNPSETRKGTRKLICNAEYRINFSDMFQGVFFYDWGNSWDGGLPDLSSFISGWGPGVRITTPLGPIRLDYGVAGGKAFGEGVMHFSIGQAF